MAGGRGDSGSTGGRQTSTSGTTSTTPSTVSSSPAAATVAAAGGFAGLISSGPGGSPRVSSTLYKINRRPATGALAGITGPAGVFIP